MGETLRYYPLEKTIAKWYILLLPLRMLSPIGVGTGVLSAVSVYFDFLLHFLGMAVLLVRSGGKFRTTRHTSLFGILIGFLLLISFSMSVVLLNKLGTLDGENTLDAIVGPTIYYVQYFFIVLYNVNIFGMFTIDEIDRLLGKTVKWQLLLGYVQIAVCIGIGVVSAVYDGLDVFDVFRDSSYIQRITRIPLAGSEPASAGCVIGILVFPYLLGKILQGQRQKQYVLQLLLWLPVVYFTKSSTCYILVVTDLLVFMVLYIRNRRVIRSTGILFALVAVVVGLVLVLSTDMADDNELVERIRYLLFEKATDRNNESSVTRTIPTHINFQIFQRYPILGIGNGNQGFFYEEFFPAWGKISINTFKKISGVADGGVFVPSLFSGFGIVGVTAVALFAVSYVRKVLRDKEKLDVMYYVFMIAGCAFVVNGFQSDYFGNYLAVFMMSIPGMANCCKASKTSQLQGE